jgi:hypothetical protein
MHKNKQFKWKAAKNRNISKQSRIYGSVIKFLTGYNYFVYFLILLLTHKRNVFSLIMILWTLIES